MPLVPVLGRQRQADLCEFEANPVYVVSFRTARATQRNPVLKKPKTKKQTRNPIRPPNHSAITYMQRIWVRPLQAP